jgi:hypothetical protein
MADATSQPISHVADVRILVYHSRCVEMAPGQPMTASRQNAGQPRLDSDVLFLELALKRGMSFAQVAGFLGRDEEEVRQKAGGLHRRSPDED